MSMRMRAMFILLVFILILYIPFSVHAATGNIFEGLPIPLLGGGSDDDSAAAADEYDASANQYSAVIDQYAANLPKPAVTSAAIDMNFMRNHMNFLNREGRSPKELCSGCHTSRADFCDKCHNYVGIKPNIDF